MNAKAKVSPEGEVVIPRDVLAQLGLQPGQVLEIVPADGGLLLRRPFEKSGRSTEEILAAIHARTAKYRKSEPVPIEDLNFPSPEEWQARR